MDKQKINWALLVIDIVFIVFAILGHVYPKIEYKRNTIDVYYEADENGIRLGENVITIDLSGTKPKIKEQ